MPTEGKLANKSACGQSASPVKSACSLKIVVNLTQELKRAKSAVNPISIVSMFVAENSVFPGFSAVGRYSSSYQ
jgi:hypothetical protein